jgi:hypothetical protein
MATSRIDPELLAARRAIRPAAWISSLVGAALCVTSGFALLHALERYQVARCPPATFLAGPEGHGLLAILLNFLALLSVSMVVGLVLSWVLAGERTWRRWAEAEYGGQGDHFRGFVKFFSISSLVLILLTTPVDFMVANSQFCLTPSSVYLSTGGRSQLARVPWSEVSAITTGCRPGRGGWSSDVILNFSNGGTADLPSAWQGGRVFSHVADYYSEYIPVIWSKLRPFRGDFDASGVQSRCPLPERVWLLHRP